MIIAKHVTVDTLKGGTYEINNVINEKPIDISKCAIKHGSNNNTVIVQLPEEEFRTVAGFIASNYCYTKLKMNGSIIIAMYDVLHPDANHSVEIVQGEKQYSTKDIIIKFDENEIKAITDFLRLI